MDNKNLPELKPEDFKFVQKDKEIHDVKFESKPTTFVKDAFKRFLKNKASVVGGIIIGIIALFSFIVPIASPSNITETQSYQVFLPPKVFEAGNGFWDGTRDYSNIVYDLDNETPADFNKAAVMDLKVSEQGEYYTNQASRYAHGGYLRFSTGPSTRYEDRDLYSQTHEFNFANNYTFTYNILDEDSEGYVSGEYYVYFGYIDSSRNRIRIPLMDFCTSYGEQVIEVTRVLREGQLIDQDVYEQGYIGFALKSPTGESRSQLLIQSAVISSSDEAEAEVLSQMSITDASESVLYSTADKGYWPCNGDKKGLYKADIYYCSFRYDVYEATFGERTQVIGATILNTYINNGWCSYDFEVGISSFEILSEKCPIISVQSQSSGSLNSITATVMQYKYLGYDEMPKFIFGTNSSGYDFFKSVFNGLRTSLLLGIIVSAVCFLFGLVWGAISGYFGGTIDLAMERFCDILGGVPWIVVITLCILHGGQNFGTFALALCLTGWMGTAAQTRAQFYRFKRREYILASRTLGASDVRLIFRHILPNAMGTIVTSSVLMIPSVIFSEATVAYLGIGLKSLDSFGVILSNNQQYLSTYSYLIIVPAVFMALVMISFNLFGNGLRDALNPSLKGSD